MLTKRLQPSVQKMRAKYGLRGNDSCLWCKENSMSYFKFSN